MTLPQPAATTELWGHAEAEQILLQLALSVRMPHAWIFTGPAGVGKATLAFRFARFLLYRGFSGAAAHTTATDLDLFGAAPAGVPITPTDLSIPPEAPVFSQVAAGSHPDLLLIAPEEDARDLTVEQIRAVAPFLALTAAQSGWRIVIIDGAERMNRAAQNALLKVLEEPSPNSLLILLGENLGRLLPTIRSRSRVLRMQAGPDQGVPDLSRFDVRLSDLAAQSRDQLWHMAGRTPGQLLQLLDQDALVIFEHLHGYMQSADPARADELARGFSHAPQFQVAGRMLMWCLHQLAARPENPFLPGLPRVRLPQLLKFHEDAQSMLAETAQLNLDGAACWHELLARLPTIFEART